MASKLLDLVGSFLGHVSQPSDASQADTHTACSTTGSTRLQHNELPSQVGVVWPPMVWLILWKHLTELSVASILASQRWTVGNNAFHSQVESRPQFLRRWLQDVRTRKTSDKSWEWLVTEKRFDPRILSGNILGL